MNGRSPMAQHAVVGRPAPGSSPSRPASIPDQRGWRVGTLRRRAGRPVDRRGQPAPPAARPRPPLRCRRQRPPPQAFPTSGSVSSSASSSRASATGRRWIVDDGGTVVWVVSSSTSVGIETKTRPAGGWPRRETPAAGRSPGRRPADLVGPLRRRPGELHRFPDSIGSVPKVPLFLLAVHAGVPGWPQALVSAPMALQPRRRVQVDERRAAAESGRGPRPCRRHSPPGGQHVADVVDVGGIRRWRARCFRGSRRRVRPLGPQHLEQGVPAQGGLGHSGYTIESMTRSPS